MAKPKTQKDLAQRIDPTYHRERHWLRRSRFLASLGCFGVAALWVAGTAATGDEGVYMNGALARSHAFLAEDCGKCHRESFGSVESDTCSKCHRLGRHVPPGEGDEPACTTCHVEHRGREVLTQISNARCNACHTDHVDITGLENHVKFKVEPREQHVAFNHAKHLEPGLQDGPLDCIDCHVPRAEGRDFAAISFDEHCARCHTDRVSGDVDVAVPHGLQPGPLRDWIAGLFVRRMREEGSIPAGLQASSVPGHGATRVPDWAAALEDRTDKAFEALLKRDRGCMLCHVVEDGAIVSPRIPLRWYGKARFHHKAHRFETCDKCHDMAANETAATLVLPEVASCRECHRPGAAPDTCSTCHPYHPVEGRWR